MVQILSVALLALGVSHSVASQCPQVEAQKNFNLTEWIRASWFFQKQQTNGYQPLSQLFCVVATYNETFHGEAKTVPFFGGKVVTVFNDCDYNKTNGPVSHNFTDPNFKPEFGSPLCARVDNKDDPAKLQVAPCALPNVLAGNYWVVEAGPSPDNYEYGIIIAGQPTVQHSDGCTTPSTCTGPSQTGCGLWVATRKQVADKAMLSMLEDAMHKKGISTQDLVTVDQTGCKYDGYELKPNNRPAQELSTVQV